MEERLRSGSMTFDDFMMQMDVMQKGASVQAMIGKLGGGGAQAEEMEADRKKLLSYKQYVADLFYEGKNLESSARLTLRMRQFAESFVIQRTGTVDQVLGEIGGFEGLMIMLIGALSGLVHVLTRLRRLYCAGSDGGPDAAPPEAVEIHTTSEAC